MTVRRIRFLDAIPEEFRGVGRRRTGRRPPPDAVENASSITAITLVMAMMTMSTFMMTHGTVPSRWLSSGGVPWLRGRR